MSHVNDKYAKAYRAYCFEGGPSNILGFMKKLSIEYSVHRTRKIAECAMSRGVDDTVRLLDWLSLNGSQEGMIVEIIEKISYANDSPLVKDMVQSCLMDRIEEVSCRQSELLLAKLMENGKICLFKESKTLLRWYPELFIDRLKADESKGLGMRLAYSNVKVFNEYVKPMIDSETSWHCKDILVSRLVNGDGVPDVDVEQWLIEYVKKCIDAGHISTTTAVVCCRLSLHSSVASRFVLELIDEMDNAIRNELIKTYTKEQWQLCTNSGAVCDMVNALLKVPEYKYHSMVFLMMINSGVRPIRMLVTETLVELLKDEEYPDWTLALKWLVLGGDTSDVHRIVEVLQPERYEEFYKVVNEIL